MKMISPLLHAGWRSAYLLYLFVAHEGMSDKDNRGAISRGLKDQRVDWLETNKQKGQRPTR